MQRRGQKASKLPPQIGVIPYLWPTKIFFQKSGFVGLNPLWCPNFMPKIYKKQMDGLQDKDRPQTDEPTDWPLTVTGVIT